MPPEGWATQGTQPASRAGEETVARPGWAGRGLSWGFYVWLIFKDRVGLEGNTLHSVLLGGAAVPGLRGASHHGTMIVRPLLGTGI